MPDPKENGQVVALEVEHARALLYGARYPFDGPTLAAIGALSAAVAAADENEPTPVTPTVRPRWDYLARATGALREILTRDPANVAHADALGAYVRDTFDALGLSVRDEATIYVALVTASLLVECSDNGRGRGAVSTTTVREISQIAQSVGAALLPYLPPEAFPR